MIHHDAKGAMASSPGKPRYPTFNWALAVIVLVVLWIPPQPCNGDGDGDAFCTSELINPRVPAYDDEWCVEDLLNPQRVLLNQSVSYEALLAAFGQRHRRTCRYILERPYFVADTNWTYRFSFGNSAVTTIDDAQRQVVQCGLACRVTDPSNRSNVFDATVLGTPCTIAQETKSETRCYNRSSRYTLNATVSVVDNFTTVQCVVMSAEGGSDPRVSAGFDDAACEAFIQYNATLWENGTVFALPRGSQEGTTAVISSDLVLSGYPTALTFTFTGLTSCPWYLVTRSSSSGMRDSTAVIPGIYDTYAALNISYADPGIDSPKLLATAFLINVTCTVDEVGGGDAIFTARLGNQPYDDSITSMYLWYQVPGNNTLVWPPPTVALSVIKPFFWGPDFSKVQLLSGVSVTRLPVMAANMSTWAPLADYSRPPLSQSYQRCYVTAPKSSTGEATTLGGLYILCSIKRVAYIGTMILNATTFCCVAPAAGDFFVWPNYVVIELSANVATASSLYISWFTDVAGITPATSLTPAPPTVSPGGGSGGSQGNQSAGNSTANATGTPSPGGSGVPSSNDAANVGAILGGTMSGVVIVCAAIIAYYYRVWRPRQDAIEEELVKNAASGAGYTPLHLRDMTAGLLQHDIKSGDDHALIASPPLLSSLSTAGDHSHVTL